MKMAGGKKTRKTNNVLKAWVKFIKKVQKEENISYRDAMRRAKIRSDKGEKWKTMKGGDVDEETEVSEPEPVAPEGSEFMKETVKDGSENKEGGIILGGKRKSARRSVRRSSRRSVRKSAKRSARRSSRRH